MTGRADDMGTDFGTEPVPADEPLSQAIGHPLFVIAADGRIVEANNATEHFFRLGRKAMTQRRLADLVPFGSPLLSLVDQVRTRGTPVNEYAVDLMTPLNTNRHFVDLHVAPMFQISGKKMPVGEALDISGVAPAPAGNVVVLIFQRAMAEKIDRQLNHRSAARSVTGLASMLGHEIKNPLSGIRGAAQLLGQNARPQDKVLTQLICDETDRICRLIDRMEVFSDDSPLKGGPVNMHAVLDRVQRLAASGFAAKVHFETDYDPSLPVVYGDQDRLIQAFLNLVKNAAEAVNATRQDGAVIQLKSAFRPGMRLSVPGSPNKVNLPLEFIVADNGPGVAAELRPHLFEPFVTSKANGSGLGLPLVAKIIGDHGGVIECQSTDRGATFRILMPLLDDTTASAVPTPGERQ